MVNDEVNTVKDRLEDKLNLTIQDIVKFKSEMQTSDDNKKAILDTLTANAIDMKNKFEYLNAQFESQKLDFATEKAQSEQRYATVQNQLVVATSQALSSSSTASTRRTRAKTIHQ